MSGFWTKSKKGVNGEKEGKLRQREMVEGVMGTNRLKFKGEKILFFLM